MDNNVEEKPLTVKDVKEVLIPAMEEVFATNVREVLMPAMEEVFTTKKDLEFLELSLKKEMKENFLGKAEFQEFSNFVLANEEKMLKDLEILMTEKEVGYFQKKKERKLWAIMIDALQKHQILSNDQIQEIKALEIF